MGYPVQLFYLIPHLSPKGACVTIKVSISRLFGGFMFKKLLFTLSLFNFIDASALPHQLEGTSMVTDRNDDLRQGVGLCPAERLYLDKRLPKVKQALEKVIGQPLNGDYVPKIALIGSGGGYRALLSTTAYLSAANDLGLLDTLTYVAGVSGSSWALNLWMAQDLSIQSFKKVLLNRVCRNPFSLSTKELKLFWQKLTDKRSHNHQLNFVDIFGGLLANTLLQEHGDDRHTLTLSDQLHRVQNGQRPFPIYTAVTGEKDFVDSYKWYEITPCEVGAPWLGHYVSAHSFGSKFSKGVCSHHSPEQSLGFVMGACGSAFAANLKEVYVKTGTDFSNKAVKKAIEKVIDSVGDIRLTSAYLPNFTYGMPTSPLQHNKKLHFVDAGVAFSLPYPPISGERPERKADIIIMVDTSNDLRRCSELQALERYARDNNLPFPRIDYTDLSHKPVHVFKDEDNLDVPVVIYMPVIKVNSLWKKHKNNPDFADIAAHVDAFNVDLSLSKDTYYHAANFCYKKEKAEQLCAVADFNMRISFDSIKNAIEWVVQKKS